MLEALKNATHTTPELLTAFEILTMNLSTSNDLLSNLSQRVEALCQQCYSSRPSKMGIADTKSDVTTPECVPYEDSRLLTLTGYLLSLILKPHPLMELLSSSLPVLQRSMEQMLHCGQ